MLSPNPLLSPYSLECQLDFAGIGIIYSDEILYRTGVHPETKCVDLGQSDWENLVEIIYVVFRLVIHKNQMTPEEYLDGKGKKY